MVWDGLWGECGKWWSVVAVSGGAWWRVACDGWWRGVVCDGVWRGVEWCVVCDGM